MSGTPTAAHLAHGVIEIADAHGNLLHYLALNAAHDPVTTLQEAGYRVIDGVDIITGKSALWHITPIGADDDWVPHPGPEEPVEFNSPTIELTQTLRFLLRQRHALRHEATNGEGAVNLDTRRRLADLEAVIVDEIVDLVARHPETQSR